MSVVSTGSMFKRRFDIVRIIRYGGVVSVEQGWGEIVRKRVGLRR